MVLTLIVGSDFYCILPSQSPKGDSSPRGRAKSVCEFGNSSINGNLEIIKNWIIGVRQEQKRKGERTAL